VFGSGHRQPGHVFESEVLAVLIEGSLVSSTHERPTEKGTKATTAKITAWSIRADVVRKLDRGDPEPEGVPSDSHTSDQTSQASDAAPF
jgi:hypothetical protein